MNSGSRKTIDPKQTRSIRSRQLVLDAARQLIEEVGIDGLTLAAVAARAGVAVGTVYTRFDDRTHLIEEVVRAWTSEVSTKFPHPPRDGSDEAREKTDPRESLSALVTLFRENRIFIRQLLIHTPLMPAVAAITEPWLAREHAELANDLVRSSPATGDRAKLVATMILATVERSALNEADDGRWADLKTALPEAGALLLDR